MSAYQSTSFAYQNTNFAYQDVVAIVATFVYQVTNFAYQGVGQFVYQTVAGGATVGADVFEGLRQNVGRMINR